MATQAVAALPSLIAGLKSDDPLLRESSAEVLGRIGPGAIAAEPALQAALKDGDAAVRKQAALALFAIGVGKTEGNQAYAFSALLEDLDMVNGQVSKKAATDLGGIGKEAVPALVKFLQEPHAHRHITIHTLMALQLVGKDAVPDLLTALKGKDENATENLVKALVQIGPPGVPELVKALEDENEDIHHNASKALGALGPAAKEGVPALIQLLQHETKFIRNNAVSALAAVGPSALPQLIAALKDSNELIRGNAAAALGNMGPDAKAAIPALREMAATASTWPKNYAGAALLNMEGNRVIQPIAGY
jgi:HEAT repeat protein